MDTINTIAIKDSTTNPGPLGLAAFALTTILLNLHNAGLFALDTMILSMGIFFGGLTQVIVGVLEFKKNNMFGTMAFSSYGAFWLSLVFLLILPKMGLGEASTPIAMGCYLALWGVYSFGLFIATFKMNKAMQILFLSVVLLFGLLATANFTGSHTIHTIAGIEGVICGSIALYISLSQLYENVFGRPVLPLG